MEAAIAEQERLNRLAAGYYGIALAGLVAVPIIRHAVDVLWAYTTPKLLRPVLRPVQRLMAGISFGDVLVMPIHIFLGLAFIGLNVGLIAWKMQWTNQAYLGSRTGWLALCNMCLTVFFGLKNTPMSILAGQTYRDLNTLHRFCGYTTVIEVILHGSLFSSGLFQHHAESVLRTPVVYAGAVAGIAMLLIALTASSIFRKRFYEAFYVLHILLVAITLVAMALHQPWIRAGALIVTIVAILLWVIDRAFRFFRWSRNALHGHCTVTALPMGAVRVTFDRNIPAAPGSHGLLWIPSIRLFQQHPFSILNNGHTEFVITARKGFTRALYDAACRTPGMRCRASLEGPYSFTPDLSSFNQCLMIAGGSGVTFAMSLAQEWLRITPVSDTTRTLHFVWVVRSATHFQWLSDQLQRLKEHPRVSVSLHVTGRDSTTKDLADGEVMSGYASPVSAQERSDSDSSLVQQHDLEKTALEKGPSTATRSLDHRHSRLHHFFHHGRPVIDDIFEQALMDVRPDDKLLVTGSGPARLLTDIRAVTSEQIKTHGPSIKLHIEEYEW